MRRPIAKRFMKPFGLVKTKIGSQSLQGFLNRPVIMKINFLVFNRAPQSLHKDVVIKPAAAFHANPDFGFLQESSKFIACKLYSLVRIKDLWFGNPQSILQGLKAKLLLQCDRKLPG